MVIRNRAHLTMFSDLTIVNFMHTVANLDVDRSTDAAQLARTIQRLSVSAAVCPASASATASQPATVPSSCLPDGRPIIGISNSSDMAEQIIDNAQIKLAYGGVDVTDDWLPACSVILVGKARVLEDELQTARFWRRFPELSAPLNDENLLLLTIDVQSVWLQEQNSKNIEINITDYILDIREGEADVESRRGKNLRLHEQEALDHMNNDHPEIALALATKLLGCSAGPWKFTGFDPEGCDLQLDHDRRRLAFPRLVLEFATLKLCIKKFLSQPEPES